MKKKKMNIFLYRLKYEKVRNKKRLKVKNQKIL